MKTRVYHTLAWDCSVFLFAVFSSFLLLLLSWGYFYHFTTNFITENLNTWSYYFSLVKKNVSWCVWTIKLTLEKKIYIYIYLTTETPFMGLKTVVLGGETKRPDIIKIIIFISRFEKRLSLKVFELFLDLTFSYYLTW